MANQPAADSVALFFRVPQALKDQMQAEIDRLNAANPGANYTLTSWLKGLIKNELNK